LAESERSVERHDELDAVMPMQVGPPGGRLAVSDIVAIGDLPAAIAADPAAYTGCIAGAAAVAELERMIAGAGFKDVRIAVQEQSRVVIGEWSPGTGAEQFVASALIEAVKPA
jgi:hypothetical protein